MYVVGGNLHDPGVCDNDSCAWRTCGELVYSAELSVDGRNYSSPAGLSQGMVAQVF